MHIQVNWKRKIVDRKGCAAVRYWWGKECRGFERGLFEVIHRYVLLDRLGAPKPVLTSDRRTFPLIYSNFSI